MIDNENYLCLLVLKSPVEDPAFEQPSEKNGWTFLQQKVFFHLLRKNAMKFFYLTLSFHGREKRTNLFSFFPFCRITLPLPDLSRPEKNCWKILLLFHFHFLVCSNVAGFPYISQ